MEKSEVKLISKRGQLTIFIILGLVIISALLVFFLYARPTIFTSSTQLSVDACVSDVINSEVEKLSLTAGLTNSNFNHQYLDENYTFICYTSEFYKPCVVQVPFLTSQFEENLRRNTASQIESCYEKSVDELESQGYTVLRGDLKAEVLIQPTDILVRISSPTTVASEGSTQTFDKFEIKLNSDLYEVLAVANSILQFETTYGDTDTSSFMTYYPNLIVEKVRRDDSVKLYNIDNRKDIKFRFAIRSYAWPPGFAV